VNGSGVPLGSVGRRNVVRRRWSKYGATRTEIDGVVFASRREALRYAELKLRLRAGEITDLELQPVFPLHVVRLYRNGWPVTVATVAKYLADFSYLDLKTGEIVVEDVKGFSTETYRLKKKIAEAVHGITITEVR
jgi:hypothetical protein